MDPDECLKICLSLAKGLLKKADLDPHPNIEYEAVRLAEHLLKLDEWISKGGFLPTSWNVTWNRLEL